MDSRKLKISESDKNLISEQPGMKVVWIGLAIAFLLGFTTRSILSDSRVSGQIERAARQIHKDVNVSFTQAHFSLSDGILPRMAVVISGVRMESPNPCWAAPVLEVDEISLPISFWALLQGKGAVRHVEAGNMKVVLREELKNCAGVSAGADTSSAVNPPLVTISSTSTRDYQNDIQTVTIQKLEMEWNRYPQYRPEFLNFTVTVKSFEPRVIEVTAKSQFLKNAGVGDYLSHANIFLQYKESPEPQVQVHFFGNWREGHYSLIGNYTVDENLLTVEMDLKHIPLSQIIRMAQRYDLAAGEIQARQLWVSAKGRMTSALDQISSTPLQIRDLRMEGDVGELRADRINITSLQPFVYEPIVVDLRRLDVQRLVTLFNGPKKNSTFGSMGHFSGRAEVISEKKIFLTGEHTGLEFVFANKGQSELQVIDSMVGDVSLLDDTWDFNIRRVEPRGGIFIGNVRVKADRHFSDIDIKTRIEEVSLTPGVQRLMTNGGHVGATSLDADMKLKEGQLEFLKGVLRVASMKIEGLDFGATRAQFDWSGREVSMQTQIKSLLAHPQSPGGRILQEVTPPTWWNPQGLELTALSGELRFKSFAVLTWRNFQAQVGKNGKWSTEGAWLSSGELRGGVTAKEGKLQTRWQISGSRETPRFTPLKEEGNFSR